MWTIRNNYMYMMNIAGSCYISATTRGDAEQNMYVYIICTVGVLQMHCSIQLVHTIISTHIYTYIKSSIYVDRS